MSVERENCRVGAEQERITDRDATHLDVALKTEKGAAVCVAPFWVSGGN